MSQKENHKHKRKLSGFFIKPRIQIELIISVVIPTIFFGLATSLVIYFQLGDIFDTLFILSDLDPDTADSLSKDWDMAIIWLIIFIIIYVLMTSVVCLIHSHRMIGPTQAFIRHLKSLIGENYRSRIKLREGDYYQNIADLFNDLSEKLEIKFAKLASKVDSTADAASNDLVKSTGFSKTLKSDKIGSAEDDEKIKQVDAQYKSGKSIDSKDCGFETKNHSGKSDIAVKKQKQLKQVQADKTKKGVDSNEDQIHISSVRQS